jgi:integrase
VLPQPQGITVISEKIRFTRNRILDLPIPATGRVYYYDSEQPRLVVCITSTGARTFYLYRKIDGKPTRILLGKFDAISVDDARAAARVHLGRIEQGENPQTLKRAKAAKTTLGELWEGFFEKHAKVRKRSWVEDEKRYTKHLKKWSGKRLSSISAADVQGLIDKIGKKAPYQANRVRALLGTMFAKAQKLTNYQGPNPILGVERFPEHSRERFLYANELQGFFSALQEVWSESPTAVDALGILILTGQRKGNVLSMTWEEVNLDRGVWTIPASKHKNGRQQSVPLVASAMNILQRRRLEAKADAHWVFPSIRKGIHLMDITKPWQAVLKKAGLSGLRVHDLRRTAGSWMTATGSNLTIVGKALGHSDPSATAVYARVDLDPIRQALNRAESAMLKTSNIKMLEATGAAMGEGGHNGIQN